MSKKIKLPAVLIANDLRQGHVLFWHQDGWKTTLTTPEIAFDDGGVAKLDEIAKRDTAANIVVDADIVEVDVNNNSGVVFRNFRERIKLSGPSIKYGTEVSVKNDAGAK